MAITAHRLRRLEVWSAWKAAGGARQAVIADASACTALSNREGSDRVNLTLPINSAAAPFVVPGAVIRVEEADDLYDEWKIVEGPIDDDANMQRSVAGAPLVATDMVDGDLIRRIDSDGTNVFDFESLGLSAADQITQWVLPAFVRAGMPWISLGTISTSKLIDLTFSWDQPLKVLQTIADFTETELDVRRVSGGYVIDLVAEIGAGATIADIRFDKNLRPGTKRSLSSSEQATRVFPRGANEGEGYATMSRAAWAVVSTAGPVIVLADPAGGLGPIEFDGQLVGTYLREPQGVLRQVVASSAAAQSVTLASAISGYVTVGDRVQFRSDAVGSDLTWLDSPVDLALYGLKVGRVDLDDVPSTNNLLKNAVMRTWPGSTSLPPTNWTKVGAGTVARQAVSPYTRIGGFSIHRVGAADGDGVISDATPIIPTLVKPYISGYAGLWVVSGMVRVELVFTTAGGPVVQPLPPDFATNSVLGQWEDLGAAGMDANALGATAVALRVVQHGPTPAEFYLDYGQVTESPAQLPFAESSGGTKLWQAANERLRTNGAPLVTFDIPIVDLAELDPATWGEDCKVVVGGKVRVTDPRLGIAITTRVVELQRDYKIPGDTKITLSNKPDEIAGAFGSGSSNGRINPGVTGTQVDRGITLPGGIIKDYTPFASSLEPVGIVSALPGSGAFVGQLVILTTDHKLYRWTGTAWTAAVDTVDLTGTINTAQIADLAITAAKLGALAVEAGKIAAGAVGTTELTALAVSAAKVQDSAITTAKIADAAVAAGKIAANAVGTTELNALAVTTAKIAAQAVTTAELAALAVTTGKLALLAVTEAILAASAVTETKIATDAVTTPKLLAGAVTAAKIAAHTITANEIAADTITATEIGADAITANEIAALAVTTAKLDALAVTTAKLDALAVTAAKIAANTITAAQLAAHTITAAEIAAGTITATEIAALAITTAKLDALSVTAAKIAAATITAAQIAGHTISAAEIVALTITAAEIAAGTITAAKIASHTITAAEIAALTITAAEIAALTITAAKIAVGTITADKLVANSLTAGQIQAGAIGTTELAAGAITTAKIAAGAVTANEINAATITADKIVANTITINEIALGTIPPVTIVRGVHLGASQTIVTGTLTEVNYDSDYDDALDLHRGTDLPAFHADEARTDGILFFRGRLTWDTNTTGIRQIFLRRQSGATHTTIDFIEQVPTSNGLDQVITGEFTGWNQFDRFYIAVQHNSGSNRTINAKIFNVYHVRGP